MERQKGTARVKLGELLDTAISMACRSRNKGIVVCPEVRQDPEICAVPGEIQQLMSHLLSNSFDAVDINGHVRVRLSAGKDWSTSEPRSKIRRSGLRLRYPGECAVKSIQAIRHYQNRRWDGTRPLDLQADR